MEVQRGRIHFHTTSCMQCRAFESLQTRWESFAQGTRAVQKRFDVVITFLAVLEMCRLKMMRVYQTEPLAPLHVDLVVIDEDAPENEEPAT